ncbi:MAG: AarF/ABC1/UbiB kinase family protein [bacterium]|nr:AarF/ABC1/UbiB kinase family protein [bacterium]
MRTPESPLKRELDRQRKRRPAVPPAWGQMPALVGRGRATVRHFTALLFGGYVAYVRAQKERGRRGLIYRIQVVLSWMCRIFLDGQISRLPYPEQLRRRLEMLGPTYIKLGQILSLRRDIIPEVVTEELKNLLSFLPPVDFEEIRGIVESDLGLPLEEVFASVDDTPMGSASIAQTHRAVTVDDLHVVLKVVKPGIRELLYRDASLLKMFGIVLQRIVPRFQPKRVIEEFFDYTLRELDMRLEAENAETFAANFRDQPEIVFPKIFREFSGESVLCMEFLDGVPPDHDAANQMAVADREKVIDLGASAIISMVYRDGFFHADLHPGNLFLLEGPKVGFIDLGMVGRLDPELKQSLLFHYYSLVMEDYENAARHLADVAETEQRSDVMGFRRAVKELCRRWRRSATFEEFSLALLILESVRLGARYRVYFPVEMVLLVKALVTYEGVGYMLNPDFNVADLSQRHITGVFRQFFSPVRLLQEGMRGAPDLVNALVKLPSLVSETLRLLEKQARRRPENPFAGLRATLFGSSCLMSGAILIAVEGPWTVSATLMLVGLVVALRRG